MFCVHCGTKLEDSSRFCFRCGKPVAVSAPVKPVEEEVPAVPVAEEVPVAPVGEEVPAEPVVEEVPAEPVEEETLAEPAVEEVPAEAVEEETPAEPIEEETSTEPVAEEPPVLSEMDQTAVLPPVAAETIAEEKAQKKDKKARPAPGKPHIMLRILTQFLSFLLCLVLIASLVGTVALADLNRIMSKDGIQQLVSSLADPAPQQAAAGARTVAPSDIPEDILTGGDSRENIDNLASWLYNMIAEASDQPLTVTEEQILALVREPAISAFIAEKLAGFAEDFINKTQKTTVTAQEILAVVEENQLLIEEKLDIELTGEVKANLERSVHQLVVEQDLAGNIQGQVFETVESAINDSIAETGMTWEKIQPVVKFICSDLMLYLSIGLCVVLMLLLLVLNFYNIPGGLIWIAVPCILVGGISTVALALAALVPKLFPAVPAATMQLLASFSKTLLPVHGAVLGFGLLLLIVAIIWFAVRKSAARKQAAAKA